MLCFLVKYACFSYKKKKKKIPRVCAAVRGLYAKRNKCFLVFSFFFFFARSRMFSEHFFILILFSSLVKPTPSYACMFERSPNRASCKFKAKRVLNKIHYTCSFNTKRSVWKSSKSHISQQGRQPDDLSRMTLKTQLTMPPFTTDLNYIEYVMPKNSVIQCARLHTNYSSRENFAVGKNFCCGNFFFVSFRVKFKVGMILNCYRFHSPREITRCVCVCT